MKRAFAIALALVALAGCRDDSPAPAEPQSAAAAAPAHEPIRRPELAIDPVERAKGVEQEVFDAKKKNDEAIEAGGG